MLAGAGQALIASLAPFTAQDKDSALDGPKAGRGAYGDVPKKRLRPGLRTIQLHSRLHAQSEPENCLMQPARKLQVLLSAAIGLRLSLWAQAVNRYRTGSLGGAGSVMLANTPLRTTGSIYRDFIVGTSPGSGYMSLLSLPRLPYPGATKLVPNATGLN